MPRLLSLVLAFVAWQVLLEHPEWVNPPDTLGMIGVIGVTWLFAVRWSLPRKEAPWEYGSYASIGLPLLAHIAFLGPFGGLHIWQAWDLPPILSSWIGVFPFVVLQAGFRYGEAAIAGLEDDARWRYVTRQTLGLFLGILPLAIVAQLWETGHGLLPADPADHTGFEQSVAFLIDMGSPLVALAILLVVIPYVLGAAPGEAEWQEKARRFWRGKGPAPRILAWPTDGLYANALAVGFGPLRRVLVSDRLVERLRPAEFDAVLAHELAHLRRRHALSLLAGVFGSIFLVAALMQFVAGPLDNAPVWLGFIPLLGGLVFIPASRVFEMQADLDAIEEGPLVAGALVGALTLLGHRRKLIQFRHLPTPKRVAELERCIADPAHTARWQTRASRWRIGLWALFFAGFASAGVAGL